jgi:hypothetical protein
MNEEGDIDSDKLIGYVGKCPRCDEESVFERMDKFGEGEYNACESCGLVYWTHYEDATFCWQEDTDWHWKRNGIRKMKEIMKWPIWIHHYVDLSKINTGCLVIFFEKEL